MILDSKADRTLTHISLKSVNSWNFIMQQPPTSSTPS